MLHCCGMFKPEYDLVWHLTNKEVNGNFYYKRKLEAGLCPMCSKFVVSVRETNLKTGIEKVTIFKERKAYKAFEYYQNEKVNIDYTPKTGTKAKMNWIYGEQKEIKERKTNNVISIRKYEVDFNGTRKLLGEIEVDYDKKIYYSNT